ncbi:MAG: hypothetical protein L0211_06590 [Planctomycetaceae bacterium]|nr:hypothetical protein [Planctomycetaceae bacterium]
MHRRTWMRSLAFALCSLSIEGLAHSQEEPRGVATLTETLRFGLKARRPVEFEFIDLVVQKVEQKLLPRDMVLSAMTYAQSKNKDRPYPYFEFSMKKRAAAIGVAL